MVGGLLQRSGALQPRRDALLDHFPEVNDWNVRILATDLSGEMLGRAASGRFSQLEVNRGLPAPRLVKHFTRDGAVWQISDRIRQMVEFRMVNLIEPWPFIPAIDVLLCRNVLIYFDLPTKQQVLARCREVLRPDGLLILGGSADHPQPRRPLRAHPVRHRYRLPPSLNTNGTPPCT